jgi:DNA-binding protein HU-beta
MRKAELVSKIAEALKQDKYEHLEKADVLLVLEKFFTEVKDSLSRGVNVYVRNFGSFVAKQRARKIGRNIQAKQALEIPAHYVPAFKPAKVFVDVVKSKLTVTGAEVKTEKKATKKPRTTKKTTAK